MTKQQAKQALLDIMEKIVSNSNGTSAIDNEVISVLGSVLPIISAAPQLDSVLLLVDDYDLSPVEDHGKLITIGADAKVIGLPDTARGLIYRFANIGADGNNIVTISPQATDGIAGTVTLASSVVKLDGTVDKDLINTKATATLGDSAVLIGTGVPGTHAWILLSSTGIWARQA